MLKVLIGIMLGFILSMSMRTAHSIAFEYYYLSCENMAFDEKMICANKKMGNLNLLSTISGFPMRIFQRWEWHG